MNNNEMDLDAQEESWNLMIMVPVVFVGNGFAVVVAADPAAAPELDGAAFVVNDSGVVPDDYKLDPPVIYQPKSKQKIS